MSKEVFKTIAFCKRECYASFAGAGSIHYLGGDVETEKGRVAQLANSEHFSFVDVFSQEECEARVAQHNKKCEAIKRAAKELGLIVIKDGLPITKQDRL